MHADLQQQYNLMQEFYPVLPSCEQALSTNDHQFQFILMHPEVPGEEPQLSL